MSAVFFWAPVPVATIANLRHARRPEFNSKKKMERTREEKRSQRMKITPLSATPMSGSFFFLDGADLAAGEFTCPPGVFLHPTPTVGQLSRERGDFDPAVAVEQLRLPPQKN